MAEVKYKYILEKKALYKQPFIMYSGIHKQLFGDFFKCFVSSEEYTLWSKNYTLSLSK